MPYSSRWTYPVPPDYRSGRLKPLTKRHYDTFSQCTGCGKLYWKGSHRDRLHPKVQSLLF
ncbi:Mut7-C RNAse domain-containing protein [Natronogracilivirga saccharolytica]|uniref:Mut7-C RNAse domain-containing protein n=1 Tax=Natronogracilivirga saccharolytica TaxID=2812953 RepID=A0A8J7RM84_9BACT|nr:hypothetical protein [Natronogracilivirga saccharolytica]